MKIKDRVIFALGCMVAIPLVTFLLLWIKGLPDFARGHLDQVVLFAYVETWLPALLTGAALSIVTAMIIQRTSYFHRPYDFGRSFSLGAVLGALLHGALTFLYRSLTEHVFSSFWIAGAMIAGSIVGAIGLSIILSRLARQANAPGKAPF